MKRFVSLLLACALLCAVWLPTAYAEPTPERDTIYLNVGDTYTIETGRTIGTDEMLNANWYSSDSSKLRIVGSNYNKDTSDVRAVASSGGEIIIISVEFEEYWGYPWTDLIPGRFEYYFVILGEAPQSITLPPTAELTDTTSLKLTPEFTPENAETTCTWSSSDPSVATVSGTGLVKGVSKGTAVITAETVNGLTARCTVTVKPTNVCGDDLEWSVSGGVLTISGTGPMYDYTVDGTPWARYNGEITRIHVSEGVTGIGDYAFSGSAASEVSLPESLLELGEEVFFDCPNLQQLHLPAGARSLSGDSLSGHALKRISVSGENPYFSAHDGVLFNKDMTALVRYPSGKEGAHYCVPGCVERICSNAFYQTWLDTLYVPETVTEIDYFGLSTLGLTVYGAAGSTAEQAVAEYVSGGLPMYFQDISAADYALVGAGSAVGHAGGTVSVPVTLSGNPGFANLNLQISYDPEKLSLQAVQGEALGALYTEVVDTDAGLVNLSWDSADNIAYDGILATLTFEVTGLSGRTLIGVRPYPGLDGNYEDGYDVNYTQDFQPLELHYMSGDVFADPGWGSISVTGLTAEERLRFSVELASEAEIDGVLAAAVYDSGGRLRALELRPAAAHTVFELELAPDASRLSVFWLDSAESLRPRAEPAELKL